MYRFFPSLFCTPGIQDEREKITQYKLLLDRLPRVNKATLQALINHLYWWDADTQWLACALCISVHTLISNCVCFSVQRYSELNQMNLHNLAIVFGPTLFQTDGQDYTAGQAIEDLIQHYTLIFEVSLSYNRMTEGGKALHFYSHFLNAYPKRDNLQTRSTYKSWSGFHIKTLKLTVCINHNHWFLV